MAASVTPPINPIEETMYNPDNSPGKPIHNYADRLKDLRRLDRYEVARNTLIQLIEEHQFIPSQENGYKVDVT